MVCSAHTEPGSLRFAVLYNYRDLQSQVRDTEHQRSRIVVTLEGLITLIQPTAFAYFIRTKSSPSHYGVDETDHL